MNAATAEANTAVLTRERIQTILDELFSEEKVFVSIVAFTEPNRYMRSTTCKIEFSLRNPYPCHGFVYLDFHDGVISGQWIPRGPGYRIPGITSTSAEEAIISCLEKAAEHHEQSARAFRYFLPEE